MIRKPSMLSAPPPMVSCNKILHPGDDAPLYYKESEYFKMRNIEHYGGHRDTINLKNAVQQTAQALESMIKKQFTKESKGYANPYKHCVSQQKKRFEMDGFN